MKKINSCFKKHFEKKDNNCQPNHGYILKFKKQKQTNKINKSKFVYFLVSYYTSNCTLDKMKTVWQMKKKIQVCMLSFEPTEHFW